MGSLALTALTGCTGSGAGGPAGTVDPRDAAAASTAASRETGLIQAYDAALQRHPALADFLGVVRAHHTEHLRALATHATPGPTGTPSAPASAAGTAAPDRGGSPGGAQPSGLGAGSGTPADPAALADTLESRAATLAELAELERTAAAAHRTDCLAVSGQLAPLLASLCAAESAHAELLAQSTGAAG